MNVNVGRAMSSDPLFPGVSLLSLSDAGGAANTTPNTPGILRPFAATLGVPRPITAKKHDTTTTQSTTRTPSQTHRDGGYATDTVTDTSTDT